MSEIFIMNQVGDHFVWFQMGRWCLNDESWIFITPPIKGLSEGNELRIKNVASSNLPSCKNTNPKDCETCRFLAWMYMVGGKPVKNYPRMVNLRRPKLGETVRCGVCFGEIFKIGKTKSESVDEEYIKVFDRPMHENQKLWVHQQALYNVFEDCFLGYCGCEDAHRYD